MNTIRIRPLLVESKEIPNVGDLCFSPRYEGKLLVFGNFENSYQNECKKQELILISLEDEKIEGNNYVYNNKRKIIELFKYIQGTCEEIFCRKVITRQSQIPAEYISKFIEQYNNGSVEDLEIEMEHYWINSDSIKGNFFTEVAKFEPSINQYDAILNNRPKLTNGFVTIVEKEPIRYIEKEVRELLKKVLIDEPDESDQMSAEDFWEWFDIWFEQNKKK